jgi:hypothetical protein
MSLLLLEEQWQANASQSQTKREIMEMYKGRMILKMVI